MAAAWNVRQQQPVGETTFMTNETSFVEQPIAEATHTTTAMRQPASRLDTTTQPKARSTYHGARQPPQQVRQATTASSRGRGASVTRGGRGASRGGRNIGTWIS